MLQGNITSAREFGAFLECRHVFLHDDIDFISDENNVTPDADTILKALVRLVKDAAAGDILLFVFSGHRDINPATYNNSRAHVEFLLTGAKQGELTSITDGDLRAIVQTIPEACSFTTIADCFRSGVLVEGANEISNRFIDNSIRAPRNEVLWELNNPCSHDSGILITACQNEVTSKFFVDGKPKSFFLNTLMVALDLGRFGLHASNRSLVEEMRLYMTDERILPNSVGFVGRKQQPWLYCNPVQADLGFLSLEVGRNVDPSSDGNSGGNGGSGNGISEGSHCSFQAEAYLSYDENLLCRRMEELSCDDMTDGGSSRSRVRHSKSRKHEATPLNDSSSSSRVQSYGDFGFVAPFEGIPGNYNDATMNYPPRNFKLCDDVNNNDA